MYGYRRGQGRLYRYGYMRVENLRYVKLRGYYAGLYVNLGEKSTYVNPYVKLREKLCKILGKPGKILWGI